MSINDPILEMLSFAVDSNLSLSDSGTQQPIASSSNLESSASKSSNDFTPSSVLFGNEDDLLCLFPNCSFKICGDSTDKKLEGDMLEHLLSEHKLVIDNADELASWAKYFSYWRERFTMAPVSNFCVGFVMENPPKSDKFKRKGATDRDSSPEDKAAIMSTPDQSVPTTKNDESSQIKPKPAAADKNMYFMLTPALPEDSQLRKKLWKQRLDIVLDANRQEREDTNFSRRCLFCREIVSGNRSQYLIHMRDNHSFHIGQPDNLVFIKELLQLIEDKLNSLECLFCEHIFKDKAVLKEHMRKKQHRQLNPKNREYDRFYVVNYLEPGKTWETIQQEDVEDERKEEEWTDPLEEKERINVVCLFCKDSDSNFQNLLGHMKKNHHFDFLDVTSALDFYQKIKMVNFIRRTVYQHTCVCCDVRFQENDSLIKHIGEHSPEDFRKLLSLMDQWNQAEYFFPTYDNDAFLTCLDNDDHTKEDDTAISSEDEGKVIPEDLPQIDMNDRDFDLAGFAIRFHNNQKS